MADRLHPADPQHVGHDGARRATAPLRRDPALLREAHQVPADQEELGEAGPLDHVQFMGELPDDRRGQRVIAPASAVLAQLHEIAERGLPLWDRESRKAVLLEAEINRARRRQLHRRRDPFRPGLRRPRIRGRERGPPGRQRGHLRTRLQVRLAIRPAQVAEHIERPAVADRGQDIGQLAILAPSVVDVVGDHHRHAQLCGQRRRFRDEPIVVGEQVMAQFDEEAARCRAVPASEQGGIPFGRRARPRPIARPQPAGQFPLATARQRHQSFGVLGKQRLAEPGHALRARHVGP